MKNVLTFPLQLFNSPFNISVILRHIFGMYLTHKVGVLSIIFLRLENAFRSR